MAFHPHCSSPRHDYTARGQLAATGWSDSNNNWLIQFATYNYLADGKVDHQDYANGVRTEFGYDGRGMTQIVWHHRSSPYQNYSYRTFYRDERDRIVAFQKSQDSSVNPMEDGRGDHYYYDAEGQLTDADYDAADPLNNPNSWLREDHFSYDALGNRFGWDYVASRGQWMNFTRKDNGLNQYRAWWPYSIVNYDDDIGGSWGTPGAANGVLMQDGWITAGYNALNQPILMTSAATGGNWMFFGYDPLGRCVKRWTGGLMPDGNVPPPGSNPATYFYYDGWGLIQEGPNASVISAAYILGNRIDEIVADFSMSNYQWLVHHSGARGHSTLLTDWGGNIVEQYEYDAFGYPYFYNASNGWTGNVGSSGYGNRFLFTGREWLSDLHLYDYRNRMYQPELGRFLQPDPKEFGAGDYNLYRYCHNDPVNKSDPFGLIDSALLEKLKEHLKEIEKAQRQDHEDRTQGTKKDLTPGKVISGSVKSHYKQGRMQRDSIKTEELPERKSELAGTSHYHGSSRSVDQLPSKAPDVSGVKASGLPMLFGSPMLKAQGGAILIEPRVGQEPSQETISLRYDK